VLIFALGVAGNTTIFSFISGIVLGELPFPDSGRIVVVYPSKVRDPASVGFTSLREFELWRDQAGSLESLALFERVSSVALTGSREPERVQRMHVTPEFFRVLRCAPVLGRWPDPSEATASKGDVAVLAEGLWRRRFGGDPRVLGSQIRLSDKLYTVIGVAPGMPSFSDPDVFTPLVESAFAADAEATLFGAVGRLRPGTSTDAAERDLAPAVETLRREQPKRWQGWTLRVQTLQDHLIGETRPFLLSLMGAVTFVLLIACANLAGLMLARSSSRQHEVAIRLSLGATRWALLRHSVAEMAIIATFGSAAALLLASWSIGVLKRLAPWNLPHVPDITIDARVLLFTIGIGLVAGTITGLAPALILIETGTERALRAGRFRRSRGQQVLVGCQLALCVVLLVGATLMIRTMMHLDALPLGFRVDNVIRFRATLPVSRYPDLPSMQRFASQVQDELSRNASVEAAGTVNLLPLAGPGGTMRFELVGGAAPQPGEFARNGWREAQFRVVDGDYFRALRIPLLGGRSPGRADGPAAPCAVVVNERFVGVFGEGSSVIGRSVRGLLRDNSAPICEIVGVVGDVRHWGHNQKIWPEIYYSLQQIPPSDGGWARQITFVARMRSTSAEAIETVRTAVLRVDRDQPIYDVATLSELRSRTTARERFTTILLSAFAGLSVLLAGLGVYALFSWVVSQRSHEFGIRMALGATRTRVVRLIGKQVGYVSLAALFVGVAASIALSRVLTALLFGVTPHEPITYAIVAVVLMSVALVAAIPPARQASSVDPATVLRREG
jgi:predicted permease